MHNTMIIPHHKKLNTGTCLFGTQRSVPRCRTFFFKLYYHVFIEGLCLVEFTFIYSSFKLVNKHLCV